MKTSIATCRRGGISWPSAGSSDVRDLWRIEQKLSLYVAHGVNTHYKSNKSIWLWFSHIALWCSNTSWHHNCAVLHRVFMVIIPSAIFETQCCLAQKRLTSQPMHTEVRNLACRYLTILSITQNQICYKKCDKFWIPERQFWVSILFVNAVDTAIVAMGEWNTIV